MDNYDFQKIIKYLPPVNIEINDVYLEADSSYKLYNSVSPLKVPEKGYFYSSDILQDLRTLRILFNSRLTHDRILYELNKLLNAWGPNNRNILSNSFVNLINNIIAKEERQKEFMMETTNLFMDQDLKKLSDNLSNISLKRKTYNINDLDVHKLKIKNKGVSKRKITKR